MERHFSIGVATIVALMSAHRAASGRGQPEAVYTQTAVERIKATLLEPTCLVDHTSLHDSIASNSHLHGRSRRL